MDLQTCVRKLIDMLTLRINKEFFKIGLIVNYISSSFCTKTNDFKFKSSLV